MRRNVTRGDPAKILVIFGSEQVAGGAVSRVLSSRFPAKTVIPLGSELPRSSSDLTRKLGGGASSGGLAAPRFPIWYCSQWGLPCNVRRRPPGGLLPHLFTLTPPVRAGRYILCGTIRDPNPSRLEPLAVSQHCARWSPDFPLDFGLFPLQRPSTPPAGHPLSHTPATSHRGNQGSPPRVPDHE